MVEGAGLGITLLIAGLGYSIGLSWYFSVTFPILESMIPKETAASFIGIYTFATNLGGFMGPLAYSAIVQATNNHRLAIIIMPVFNLIAGLILHTVDFQLAREQAG